MSQAKTDPGLTPEIVMETGKKMRKALLATLTPQEVLYSNQNENRNF
jgi:hypothetical protein